MKIIRDIPRPIKLKKFFSAIHLFIFLLFFIPAVSQQTYLVNSTADLEDADLADQNCADEFGNCTLRAALQNANKTSEKDKINFRLPGIGPFIIRLRTNLPAITEPVVLDATSQAFYEFNRPLVVLDGSRIPLLAWESISDLSSCPTGFFFTGNSEGSEVRGFVIGGFGFTDPTKPKGPGNFFLGFGILAESDNHKIQANYIGIAADGFSSFSNISGITLRSNGHLVGGASREEANVVSGNFMIGIFTYSKNKIIGNYIGTTADGLGAMPNQTGISFPFFAKENYVVNNLISGNRVGIEARGDDTFLYENLIGTDFRGKQIIPNDIGVNLDGALRTEVGTKSRGNLISGNKYGIIIDSYRHSLPQENRIRSNFIGTDLQGAYDLPNEVGIYIRGGFGNFVGSPREGEGNTISGNKIAGIELEASFQNRISGNFIGTDPAGNRSIPNLKGIVLKKERPGENERSGTPNLENEISFNLISGNHEHGIEILGGVHTTVQTNIMGLQKDTKTSLPNGGSGIYTISSATENCIGGLNATEANLIANNKEYGIFIMADPEQSEVKAKLKLLENVVFDNCKADIFFETPSKPKKKKQKAQPLLSIATKE